MDVQISREEAQILADVLDQAAADLRQEIGGTDLAEMRKALKRREEVCREIRDRLYTAAGHASSSAGDTR